MLVQSSSSYKYDMIYDDDIVRNTAAYLLQARSAHTALIGPYETHKIHNLGTKP